MMDIKEKVEKMDPISLREFCCKYRARLLWMLAQGPHVSSRGGGGGHLLLGQVWCAPLLLLPLSPLSIATKHPQASSLLLAILLSSAHYF